MEQNSTEQLQERINQLPEDVRSAVLSAEWEANVQSIGTKRHLHIDQIGALGDITLMAMLGIVDLADYPTRVAEDLKISSADAEALTQEISSEVFTPIRESLKKLSTKPAAEASTSASVSMPVPGPTAASVPAPTINPAAPISAPTPTSALASPAPATPAPAVSKPDLAAADAMLSGVVVSTPAAAPANVPPAPATAPGAGTPPKPAMYATDPYREPPV